jgi:SRSO17 transposase
VGRDYWYFANVKSNTLVWKDQPRMRVPRYRGRGKRPSKPRVVSGDAVTVTEIAGDPGLDWRFVKLAEGAKGPIMAEVARLRVIPSHDGVPGAECWLFIRKYPDGELKYALSNAPKSISFRKLKRAATLRWPIEQCFQEGKEQLGMDHYEHRSWPGWHRHMLFVFLAQLFLLRLRDRLKKKPNADPSSGAAVGRSGAGGRSCDEAPCLGDRPVLHQEKPCRVESPPRGAASPVEEAGTKVAPVERRVTAASLIQL